MDDAEVLEKLILEFPDTENLDDVFVPLGNDDIVNQELSREKARNWNRQRHASWVRFYAKRLEPNVYIVTGGALKLTRAMQDREHTQVELDKMNKCRAYLQANHVFDQDSFIDLTEDI